MAAAEPRRGIGAVLDASALLAHLNEEPGAERVRQAMLAGAAIGLVNFAEALSKSAEFGDDPAERAASLRDALALEPLTETDCVELARLRPITQPQGLSLADRACLALAARLGLAALTADRAWAELELPVEVELIR